MRRRIKGEKCEILRFFKALCVNLGKCGGRASGHRQHGAARCRAWQGQSVLVPCYILLLCRLGRGSCFLCLLFGLKAVRNTFFGVGWTLLPSCCFFLFCLMLLLTFTAFDANTVDFFHLPQVPSHSPAIIFPVSPLHPPPGINFTG